MTRVVARRIHGIGVLQWIAAVALALAVGCAHDGENGYGEDSASGDQNGALLGEDLGGEGAFERYGASEGSELSAAEREALGLKTIYFDFDQFALSASARETLRRNAEILKSHPEIRVEIQGNCDERGSEEYNLALGERRARAAKEYLVNSGVGSGRLATVSFGENNPAAVGQGEQAWRLNRRDEFLPSR